MPKPRYFLFVHQPVVETSRVGLFKWYTSAPIEGDEWKADEPTETAPEKTKLTFIGEMKSPKHVADTIRRNPTLKYMLITGEVQQIQVAIPVFLNGQSLDSLDAEFAPIPDPA